MISKNMFFVFIGFSLFLFSCSGNLGLSPLHSSSQDKSFENNSLNFDVDSFIMAQASDDAPPPRVAFQMSAPTAVLPADKVVNVGTEVLIDGAMSTGTSLSYRWNFDVFPVHSNAKINDPTVSSISFTPDVPGLYLVKLVVRDTNTNSQASYLSVRAVEENTPPSFNDPYYGIVSNGWPKRVQIRIDNVDDSDGEIRFIEADYGNGKKTVFENRELQSTNYRIEHYYLESGVYDVKIAMIDDDGGRTEKSVMVDLSNNPQIPVLKYSVNSTSGTAPFTIRVDASSSFDPNNNNPLHYYFVWGDGNTTYTSDSTFEHTYTTPGMYYVNTYTGDRERSGAYNWFVVYVDDPNNVGTYSAPPGGSPPVLNIKSSSSPFVGAAPLTVNFDASQSFDLEGNTFEVFWHFDGLSFKRIEKGLSVSKTFNNPGYYPVMVGLRDSHGNETRHNFYIRVYDSSVDEQPRFFAIQDGNDPYNMHFVASFETLYGVPAEYHFWDLGNGDFVNGLYTYTYSQNGIYPVTLTTVDVFGNRKSVSKLLNIDGEEHEVTEVIDPFYHVAQVGESISFTGADSTSSVPGPLSFFWYLVTGFREAVSFNYSYSEKGIYDNEMFVTNQYGLSNRASNWIAVNSGEGPKASAKFSTYIGTAPLTINFDASPSHSPGQITEYFWNLGHYSVLDRAFVTSSISYTYENPGEHYQELYIKDSNGNFDVGFYQVTVLDPADVDANNQSPTVTINTNSIVINDLELHMSSTMSDSDGHIRYTEWDWGDGKVDVFRHDENSPYHEYENYGSYTVTVRVFDNMGAMTTATHSATLSSSTSRSSRSTRSAPPASKQKASASQAVPIPVRQNDNRFRENRNKTGCYRKEDGQVRCYTRPIEQMQVM